MKRLGFMAIDQHGTTHHLKTRHPRKELLEIFCCKHADKMYCDPNSKHIGYIIAGMWLKIYSVGEWK